MKYKSKIAKGKRFEKWCAEQVEEMGLGKAGREQGSGSGKYKGDVRANIPFLLECKNQKKINLGQWVAQAQNQATDGNYNSDKWAVIIQDPDSPQNDPLAWAVVDYHEFLKLLKKEKEPISKEPDRELKYRLQNLARAAKEVEKYLPA